MITKMEFDEVMRDFVDHAELYEAGECNLIAQNTDFGVEIYLGGEVKYLSGLFPTVTVFADDDVMFEETAYSSDAFRDMLDDVYETFLSPGFIDTAAKSENLEASETGDIPTDGFCDVDDEEEEIEEQESLLDDAVLAFLATAYGFDPLEKENRRETMLENLKDIFCQACADVVGDGVYRPMYVEDEKSGSWVFERYPYETTVDAF